MSTYVFDLLIKAFGDVHKRPAGRNPPVAALRPIHTLAECAERSLHPHTALRAWAAILGQAADVMDPPVLVQPVAKSAAEAKVWVIERRRVRFSDDPLVCWWSAVLYNEGILGRSAPLDYTLNVNDAIYFHDERSAWNIVRGLRETNITVRRLDEVKAECAASNAEAA